jgi:hypothetical protein
MVAASRFIGHARSATPATWAGLRLNRAAHLFSTSLWKPQTPGELSAKSISDTACCGADPFASFRGLLALEGV